MGGQNRTHGMVERYDRIDSFKLADAQGVADLSYRFNGQLVRRRIELLRVDNHYGGTRPFFLCPRCGGRVRFLYFRFELFRCRTCNQLNYQSQQVTRDDLYPYYKGVKLLRKRFKLNEAQIPVPIDFPKINPSRPRGMHWRTYWLLYKELVSLQNEYSNRFIAQGYAFFGWR